MARRNRKRATIIFPWYFRMSESLHLPKAELEDLIGILWREGFKVLGPVARDGAVWVVYRKGRKDFNENDVLRLGLESGMVDVKVVRFSETHTATKYVIRKAER